MEPVYYVEIQAPADCVSAVYAVLQRRRYTSFIFFFIKRQKSTHSLFTSIEVTLLKTFQNQVHLFILSRLIFLWLIHVVLKPILEHIQRVKPFVNKYLIIGRLFLVIHLIQTLYFVLWKQALPTIWQETLWWKQEEERYLQKKKRNRCFIFEFCLFIYLFCF